MKLKSWLFVLLMSRCVLFACTVPVFRYALERWPPDPHLLLHGSEDARWRELLGERMHHSNLYAQQVTEETMPPGEVRLVFEDSGIEWWRGTLRPEDMERVADSPLRREVSRELLSGTSTVFVFVQSGDPKADAPVEAEIRRILTDLGKVLELPEAPAYDEDDPRGQSMSKLPLKLHMQLLVLKADDPAEDFFRKQLLAVTEGGYEGGPILAAVFGRGRVISLPVSKINAKELEELSWFLVGPCSCQVKAQNPGYDIILTVDWDAAISEYPNEVDHSLPSGATFRLGDPPPSQTAPGLEPEALPAPKVSSDLTRRLIAGGGLLLLTAALLIRNFLLPRRP